MMTSLNNLIDGLTSILQTNIGGINSIAGEYRAGDTLHVFKGERGLTSDSYPCLVMEPASGEMKWTTTSSMTGEYKVQCTLTVNCGNASEIGVEYITELTREIVRVFNYPPNMTWYIPGESSSTSTIVAGSFPVLIDGVTTSGEGSASQLCQHSYISSVTYGIPKDSNTRTATWSILCKVRESFPPPGTLLGPQAVTSPAP